MTVIERVRERKVRKVREQNELADERVRDGMTFLDEHRPGWRDRINVEEIDVRIGHLCPLGQACGGWGIAMAYLVPIVPGPSLTDRLKAWGFMGDRDVDCDELTEAWKRALS